MAKWNCVLELNQNLEIKGGSQIALSDAIRNGADLRINTDFRHNEHIDLASRNNELVREVSEFRLTYLLDNRWSAAFMIGRQPVDIPVGFGPRPSMSLFMYNQNGQQAVARLFLDGSPVKGTLGQSPLDNNFTKMPKYHQQDNWDADTNAPSQNFIYDHDVFKYYVRDDWKEVYSHDSKGKKTSGSFDDLINAFSEGSEIKVGIRNLCNDLSDTPEKVIDHEIFTHVGFSYYYTAQKLFLCETFPVVRVKPDIPLWYRSKGWDVGWLMPRTDGFVAQLLYDPYTLKYFRKEGQYAIRWFAR